MKENKSDFVFIFFRILSPIAFYLGKKTTLTCKSVVGSNPLGRAVRRLAQLFPKVSSKA
jgi:hypothetical protein